MCGKVRGLAMRIEYTLGFIWRNVSFCSNCDRRLDGPVDYSKVNRTDLFINHMCVPCLYSWTNGKTTSRDHLDRLYQWSRDNIS